MNAHMTWRDALRVFLCIGLCLIVGALGSLATRGALPEWYAELAKPSFTPPPWIFAPVWTALYLLMGVAAFLVWRRGLKDPQVVRAVIAFGAQLLLNALWSPAFFGLRSCIAGLIVIVPLWITIAATILLFWPVSRPAALLLTPYLAWVSFATVLNVALVLKN
jgi:translocator protein